MKAFIFTLTLLGLSLPAAARCVVEIFSEEGEPLGYVYQEKECSTAMSKCKNQLNRLRTPGAACEITLDIPGGMKPQAK